MKIKCFFLMVSVCLGILQAHSSGIELPKSGSFQKTITKTKSYDYLIDFPGHYSSEGSPVGLLLFLHGSGERGNDLEMLNRWGPPKLIANGIMDFPVIVVAPQCPLMERWDPQLLTYLIDDLVEKYHIDEDRIYATGLSMGGYGVWSVASMIPDKLAAVVPICGGGDPSTAERIGSLPVWTFHGVEDKVVDIYQSTRMVSAINDLDGNVKFTVYPDADHVAAWVNAYSNQKMWDWLWSQNLKSRESANSPVQVFKDVYPDPSRFEHDINEFEEMDRLSFPEENAILCIGSSSMRCWHDDLAKDLSPLPVIPRGFGGSCMSDIVHFANRIVIPYQPRAILLYEGDNDIAGGMNPFLVADKLDQFVKLVHSNLPDCRIYVISTKPSPSRWHLKESVCLANDLMEEFCHTDERLFFINVFDAMLGEDGRPKSDLFTEDQLHMNRGGYLLWQSIIRPILMNQECSSSSSQFAEL